MARFSTERDSSTGNVRDTQSARLGILAYGSLLSEPGEELGALLDDRIEGVDTPFRVEFARSCTCRDGAPTLAPVEENGTHVEGAILTATASVPERELEDALWRRETREQRQKDATSPEVKDLLIRRAQSLEQRLGLQRVFYAHLKANIENLEPSHLADLAIESARAEAGRRREDGISYLITVKENGISTPLLDPYERAILAKAGASSLGEAREMLVNGNR